MRIGSREGKNPSFVAEHGNHTDVEYIVGLDLRVTGNLYDPYIG